MEKCTGAKILHRILDMGELMLSTGAEIKRVENTVIRLGKAFGAERVDVFAITSSIVVTMTFPEERRSPRPGESRNQRVQILINWSS